MDTNEYRIKIDAMKGEFVDLVHNRLGIAIKSYQSDDLMKCILKGCVKFELEPERFLYQIRTCSDKTEVVEYLISCVTIGETYFFRDKKQMSMLCNQLLPQVIKGKESKGSRVIRIWSAGCSSGEEIYSIAIYLKELIPNIKDWQINLLGTDINASSLKKAISGEYTEWSMRAIPAQLKHKYFTFKEGKYFLDQSIKEMVFFDYLNLNEITFPSINLLTNAQDLILCRNVLIYFDLDHITKLMKNISQCLIPEGYLILGASDPIELKNTDLQIINSKELIIQKTNRLNKPVITKIESCNTEKFVAKPGKVRLTEPVEKKKSGKNLNIDLIKNLYKENKWQELINIVNNFNNLHEIPTEVKYYQAIALANAGRLDQSVKYFEECIKKYPTDKLLYFYYGITLIELNKFTEGESALKNALFLDPLFVIAHYHLGLLMIREKNVKDGIKCMSNAFKICDKKPASEMVEGATGLNYGRLKDILTYEKSLYNVKGEKINE